ncbi:hypothetical protein J2Z44_001760 [Clostridium punense]|uniref:Class IIb bacteriocin, lactobin A/cerein 7B family n=1 Tax=Clostridium punense TaxID=1054297 RepID=A0ABS4K5P0_9CLOT|nr:MULTISPECIES: hypothetical protein [Clostridium]EQB90212.1 hypothetical protein M918_01655 [Clostridium sp. BL8]MBP2021964.1 hypothetical protein [Clostridium punense]
MKKYNDITGFVSVEELEEVSNEAQGGIALSAITFVTGTVIWIATRAVCETGACTSYCK